MTVSPIKGEQDFSSHHTSLQRSWSHEDASKDSRTAHLLAQISFLHQEVERLESQVSVVRTKALSESRSSIQEYEKLLEQKALELEKYRLSEQHRGGKDDFSQRCKVLEKQLAAANTEKNVLSSEKIELQLKVRQLMSQLKVRQQELSEAHRDFEERRGERSSTFTAMKIAVEKLTKERDEQNKKISLFLKERDVCRSEKATCSENFLCDGETQTNSIEHLSQGCQVSTLPERPNKEEGAVESAHNLAAALEQKTTECDDLRGKLEDLRALQQDTVATLDSTKRQLSSESELRKVGERDAETLSVQLRALQQRLSDQAASERAMIDRINTLESERQNILAEGNRIDRDRGEWEEQLRQYERDVSLLTANKNHTNAQLSSLANENERIRAELHRACEREAQAAYTVKAKNLETEEIISAYQKSAQENESLRENQRYLERELDNVRAAMASKEESVLYLQEQLRSLHLREQQVALDLQSYEYENERLHERLMKSDHEVEARNAQCADLQQVIAAKEHSIEELHQTLNELSKQVVIRDNESHLLRQRLDEMQGELVHFRALAANGNAKIFELEEANARFVARDILSHDEDAKKEYASVLLEDQRALVRAAIAEKEEVAMSNKKLSESQRILEGKVAALEKSLQDSIDAKERLHRIILDQNKVLSHLSE